jgi:hypothetical protein
MQRAPSLLLTGVTVCVIGLLNANAQEAKKSERPQIPGGIEGHVKKVDVEKETLTIVTTAGSERTFNVTEDTTMLGPRGGKVRRRLHDPRFHEGMELTVVASGTTAKEVHLGYSPRRTDAAKEDGQAAAKPKAPRAGTVTSAPPSKAKALSKQEDAAAAKTAAADEEDDEDDELPGTVKTYNAERRVLVVTLLNGTNRTFFLAKDLKVQVGRAVSKQGIEDPALKEGAHVTVFLAEGGRRVRELHVAPPQAARKAKKAA